MKTAESTQPRRYPRWVLLEDQCGDLDEASSSSTADAATAAACLTSSGHPIRVSVHVAAAPAESRICIQSSKKRANAGVVAAHGDSVLIDVCFEKEGYGHGWWPEDYFVYNAGAADTTPPRPPSLLLLPSPCYVDKEEPAGRVLSMSPDDTGLMRSGADKDDHLVVASLQLVTVAGSNGDDAAAAPLKMAKLHLLRHGKWSVELPDFIGGEGNKDGEQLLSSWQNHTVVSAGDGLMFWFDYFRGLIFCNVYDKAPVLGYVPLPLDVEEVDPLSCRRPYRNVCVTSDAVVKFVTVCPSCCCGSSSGGSHCRHSANAYTVRIWTLNMDGMVWEMDGMVDSTELWGLDAYKSLPRVQLAHPIVSMDEPHIIFFILCETFYSKHNIGDRTEWLVLVDTKSKTIPSVYRYDNGRGFFRGTIFFPSSLSDYFNSSSCSIDVASLVSKTSRDSEPPPPVIPNDGYLRDNASNSEEDSREEMILATLQEIPSLARDDMLKAYSILTRHDTSGRMLRSLLGLPMRLRKDWLLMEIKTSEAYYVCSACKANS